MKLRARFLLAIAVLTFLPAPQGFALVSSAGDEKSAAKKPAKPPSRDRPARSRARRVTLILGGVVDEETARALRRILRGVEGIRFRPRELKAGKAPRYFAPLRVRIVDLEKTSIGSIAKAVAAAELPRKEEVEPTVNIALYSTRDITEEAVTALRKELSDVRGVASDVPGGLGGLIDHKMFWVRLADTGDARLRGILAAARRTDRALALSPKKEKKRGSEPTAKKGAALAEVPEELRGFSGLLRGELVSKDVEKGVLVLRVGQVRKVWKPSTAKRPASAVGKTFLIDGISGKWLDALLLMEPGDTIELETHHKTGKNLSFLGEWLKKVAPEETTGSAIPDGFRGFRGIFTGKLVSKDVERGTLVVKVDGIKKTWKQNKAEHPESAVGHSLTVKGISGKWLDVLLVLEAGDRIEVEAFDNGAAHLDFVKEWLRKAE